MRGRRWRQRRGGTIRDIVVDLCSRSRPETATVFVAAAVPRPRRRNAHLLLGLNRRAGAIAPGQLAGSPHPPPPPPPSPRRRHLPRPPQNDVIPEVVPPRDHDPSHQPLLVVGPAPREGAAGVHELGTGGGEEPTAEGGGRADAVLVEVGRARAEPWPRHGRWMEWRWDADDDDDEMG
jgi:hypothetical protein